MPEVQPYINSVAPTSDLRAHVLVDACEKYDVDIIFTLAQGEIESAFGTKGLVAKTNSVWNVGVYDKLTFNNIVKKYKYAHPSESIEPYLKLLTEKYLTNSVEDGLMKKFVDHNGKRFASDPDYEERLSFKFKTIKKSTKIDSLSCSMRYLAIKCNR